jgi:cytochrome b
MIRNEIIIWDPLVRLFHWSLASTFLLNYWVTEDGSDWHAWIGYTAGALVLIRVVWGFLGPHNARFASFFPTPSRIRHHLGELKTGSLDPQAGHNPLGGAMVLTLMTLMLGLAVTGFMMEEIDLFWGEDWVEDLHEILGDLTLAAVVIHVSAVFVMQKTSDVQLVRPMVTGKRKL